MRIAHIITRLVAGGAQRNTLRSAEHQQDSGHQVTVLSGLETGSEGSLLELAQNANYRWLGCPDLVREVRPLRDLRALLALTRCFRREKFDLVHTHTSKAGILGRLAARLAGVPIVVHTSHGHVFHSYFSRWKTRLFIVLERWLASWCDSLVLLTPSELAETLEVGVTGNPLPVVIPSGVPLQRFLSLDRVEPPVFTVGYVGRLADIKGPLHLVDAFALHQQRYPDSRLLLIGDGEQRAEVEARCSRLAGVELVGWSEEVPAFLQRMSLLAVPSLNEGMGRVVVEAMAAGVPVLATRVGGLRDLVEDECLVEPADAAAMAAALDRLREEGPALAERGRRAQRRAAEYSEEVMFARLDELYARLQLLKL